MYSQTDFPDQAAGSLKCLRYQPVFLGRYALITGPKWPVIDTGEIRDGNVRSDDLHAFRVRCAELLIDQHVVRRVDEVPRRVIKGCGRLWRVTGHPVTLWGSGGGDSEAVRRVEVAFRHLARVSTLGARASGPGLQVSIVLLEALAAGGVPVPRLALGVVSAQLTALCNGLRVLGVYGSNPIVDSLFILWASRLALLLCGRREWRRRRPGGLRWRGRRGRLV